MELQLEELEADAGEDELVAEIAAKASTVKAFERRRPSRKPFPENLPRERVIMCSSSSLHIRWTNLTHGEKVDPLRCHVAGTEVIEAAPSRRLDF